MYIVLLTTGTYALSGSTELTTYILRSSTHALFSLLFIAEHKFTLLPSVAENLVTGYMLCICGICIMEWWMAQIV